MLTFEALQPLRLNTKTRGTLSLQPGERMTWPDETVRQLLAKIPERIRLVLESESEKPCPFRIGQAVFYKIPVNITSAGKYDWEWHQGTVDDIHPNLNMVTLYPNDEGGEWRMQPWRYVQEARPDALL